MATKIKKKRRSVVYLCGSIILLVVIVLGIAAATRSGIKIDATKLGKAERGDLAKSVVATGKVEPITKVEIKSKASGIVKKLLVDANDRVKQGQVLAELDRDEIQAEVRSAQAQLASAEASLRAAEADMKRAAVDAETPEVPLLKRAYDRALQMQKAGVVSNSALDDAEKAYDMAMNKREVALAQVTVDNAKMAQAVAGVQKQRATLAQLQEQLRYTTITSPINGVVLSRDVELGDAVSSILVMGSAASLIMTLGDTSEVYVKGKVNESDVGRIYIGQPARIKLESFKDKTFNGKVTKIYPMGADTDNVTTFDVRVSIINPGGDLKAGMTANAEIILEEHAKVLQIPEDALIYDNEKKAYVEIPDPMAKDGKKRIPVTVGISNGARAEILGGLRENDQVILQ